jgi:hypothetical protein
LLFLVTENPFDRGSIRRAVTVPVGPSGSEIKLASAEDIVLRKLEWFRRGHEASEVQWRDVLNIMAGRSDWLDQAYMVMGRAARRRRPTGPRPQTGP